MNREKIWKRRKCDRTCGVICRHHRRSISKDYIKSSSVFAKYLGIFRHRYSAPHYRFDANCDGGDRRTADYCDGISDRCCLSIGVMLEVSAVASSLWNGLYTMLQRQLSSIRNRSVFWWTRRRFLMCTIFSITLTYRTFFWSFARECLQIKSWITSAEASSIHLLLFRFMIKRSLFLLVLQSHSVSELCLPSPYQQVCLIA